MNALCVREGVRERRLDDGCNTETSCKTEENFQDKRQ